MVELANDRAKCLINDEWVKGHVVFVNEEDYSVLEKLSKESNREKYEILHALIRSAKEG